MKKTIAIILSILLVMVITLPAAAISSVAVKSISLNNRTIIMKVGQTSNLTATLTPENTTQKKLLYVTNNKNVASVNPDGQITGAHTGSTTITVYTLNHKIFAQCKVIVTSPDKISDTPVTLRLMRWENPAQPIRLDSPVTKEILRLTGVRLQLEPVPQSNYEDKKRILIATNNLPDIISVSQKDLNDFAPTGVFLPLLEKINKMGPNIKKFIESNPELEKFYVNKDLYAFPVSATAGMDNGRFPMIRSDLLKKYNLKMPTTYDELLNVLAEIKKAEPNNQIWAVRNKTRTLITCVAYALGSGFDFDTSYYYDWDVNGGSFLYGPAHTEFKNVLTFLNKAFSAKLLDQDYAVTTAAQWTEKLSTGKAVFYFDNTTFGTNFANALKSTVPNADFKVIPVLKNSAGVARGLKYPIGWWISDNYAISSKSNNSDIAVKLLDWMYSQEGMSVTNYGILDEHYVMVNGKPVIKPGVLAKYADSPDPFRGMQGDLGTGFLSISALVDQTIQPIVQPGLKPIMKALELDEKILRHPAYTPPLTKDQMERLKLIRIDLDTIFDLQIDKFIMGVLPISAYDDVIKQLKAKGSDELEKILNDANAPYKKK